MNVQEKSKDGYSTQRPPMLNDKFAKALKIFIKARNYQVWRVIKIGDFEVIKTNAQNEMIPKQMEEYEI